MLGCPAAAAAARGRQDVLQAQVTLESMGTGYEDSGRRGGGVSQLQGRGLYSGKRYPVVDSPPTSPWLKGPPYNAGLLAGGPQSEIESEPDPALWRPGAPGQRGLHSSNAGTGLKADTGLQLGKVAWGTHLATLVVAVALRRVYDAHGDLRAAAAAVTGAAPAAVTGSAGVEAALPGSPSNPGYIGNTSAGGRPMLWLQGASAPSMGARLVAGAVPGTSWGPGLWSVGSQGLVAGSTSTNSWLAWIVLGAYALWLLRVLPHNRVISMLLQWSMWVLAGVLWHTLVLAQQHHVAV